MNRANLRGECLDEFIGTALLLMIATGVSATFQSQRQPVGATLIRACLRRFISGAHLNPATIAMALSRGFQRTKSFLIFCPKLGFFGAAIIYGLYHPLFTEFQAINSIVPGTSENLATTGFFSAYALTQLGNIPAALVEIRFSPTGLHPGRRLNR